MAIDPEAINSYLAWQPPEIPKFKKADPLWVARVVQAATEGATYQSHGPTARPHQLEGLAFALWMRKSLLYYWMRTGKTKIALDWVRMLHTAQLIRQSALLIAHAPSGVDEIEAQARLHSTLDTAVISSGPSAIDEFLEAITSNKELIIIAWSTLQVIFSVKRPNRKGVLKLYADKAALELAASYFDAVVIDEIHLTGNHTSLRFSIAEILVQNCEYRLGLTGTPVGRNPYRLWAPLFLIDEGATLGSSYYFFEAAFGKQKKNFFTKKLEWHFDKDKMDLLRQRLASRSMSYELTEVQNVNVLAGIVELKMRGEQRTSYNEVVDKFIKLPSGAEQEVRNTFIRLRQIASGYLPFSDEAGEQRIVVFPNSAKLTWLSDFFASMEESVPCVIFHEFIQSGQMICDMLTKHKIKHTWLHGGTKDSKSVIDSFRSGKTKVLVANSAKGGTGIDLPEADYLLFYESPINTTTRQQAEARPLARGERVLLMDDLVCAPVERKILGYMQEGRDVLAAVLRDKKTLFAP